MTMARRWLRRWNRSSLPKRRRPERADLAAGLAQLVDAVVGCADAAQPIEQHAHLHTCRGTFAERVEELITDIAGLPDVDHEVDAALRGCNRGQHVGEVAVAVVEQRGRAAAAERHVEQGAERAQEVR
jgi:hypothetical protein